MNMKQFGVNMENEDFTENMFFTTMEKIEHRSLYSLHCLNNLNNGELYLFNRLIKQDDLFLMNNDVLCCREIIRYLKNLMNLKNSKQNKFGVFSECNFLLENGHFETLLETIDNVRREYRCKNKFQKILMWFFAFWRKR